MIKNKLKNIEQDLISFLKYNFVLTDDKIYNLEFTSEEKIETYTVSTNEGLVYEKWLQDASEVQWLDIKLPTFEGR